ncbi:MAG: flippase [Patescibacteria group bacterium]
MASVAKNTAYMTFASVGQKVLSFLYFTFIARMVGAEDTGKYFLALSFTTIFAVITDFGLSPSLNREVARKPEEAARHLSSVLGVKMLFMAATYVIMMAVAILLDYSSEMQLLIALSGITMILDSIHLSFYAVLRGMHKLKYEALAIVLSQLSTLIIGSIALLLGRPLVWLIIAFIVSSFLNVCYAAYMLRYRAGVPLRVRWESALIKSMLVVAFPFALAGIFARVYSYSDSVFLSKFASTTAVGWYSIPNKITFAFQFIPLALSAALYPRMSEAFICDRPHLTYLFERAMKYLILVAMPIAVFLGVFSEEIILTIYTAEYAPAIIPMQILLASVIFAFIDFPVGALLNGCNRQAMQTTAMGVAMVVNVVANILLIPPYGVIGAAIAALLGNIVLFAAGYFFVPRIALVHHGRIIGWAVGAGLLAGVVGLLMWIGAVIMPWYLTLALGSVLYCGGLVLTRLVKIDEIRYLVHRVRA